MKDMFEGLLNTISKFSHTQVAIAAVLCIMFYFLMPILKVYASSRLRVLGRREESQVEADHDVRSWLLKRTETLEKEREDTMKRILEDNEIQRNRMLAMEQEMRTVREQNEMLWRRISSLEWIFLTEVCMDLGDRINKIKDNMAARLLGLKEGEADPRIAEVSDKIAMEFNKVVEDLKTSFLMKQLEQASKEEFAMTKDDMPQRPSAVVRSKSDISGTRNPEPVAPADPAPPAEPPKPLDDKDHGSDVDV